MLHGGRHNRQEPHEKACCSAAQMRCHAARKRLLYYRDWTYYEPRPQHDCSFAAKEQDRVMTPEKLKLARYRMGYSINEMADALRLSQANGGTTIRKMEAGKINITGPIMVAVDAMLKGYDPIEDDYYEDE